MATVARRLITGSSSVQPTSSEGDRPYWTMPKRHIPRRIPGVRMAAAELAQWQSPGSIPAFRIRSKNPSNRANCSPVKALDASPSSSATAKWVKVPVQRRAGFARISAACRRLSGSPGRSPRRPMPLSTIR